MTEGNVGRKSTLGERLRLWRLRREVEAARKRLRCGRGDMIDALLVMAWDDPDTLALAAKAVAEAGITAQEAAEGIATVIRHLSDEE